MEILFNIITNNMKHSVHIVISYEFDNKVNDEIQDHFQMKLPT